MLFIEFLDINTKERCLIVIFIILLNSDALEDIYYLLKMKCLVYEKFHIYVSEFFIDTYPVNLLIMFLFSIYDKILCKKIFGVILNALIDLNINYILNLLILSILSNLYIENDLIKNNKFNILDIFSNYSFNLSYSFNSSNYSI